MELTVGPDQLGTPEDEWRRSGWVESLAAWSPPAVRSVVVVAPHPDDETLGAGGLLQRLAGLGAVIEVVAVSDGEASHAGSTAIAPHRLAAVRAQERDLALSRLGLAGAKVTSLHLPDGCISDWTDTLTEALAARLGPGSLCLAPWRHDGHPDHDACGRAAERAAAAGAATLIEYLVWAWHWATPGGGQLPAGRARRVDLSDGQRAAKSWAVEAFASQLIALGPEPDDGPILPPPILSRFRRPHEVVLV
jgi:LmbE family N-acetylglucosaminyl deacetylase